VKKTLQKKGISLGVVLLIIAVISTVTVFQVFKSHQDKVSLESSP